MSYADYSLLSFEEAQRYGRRGAIASGYKPYTQREDNYLVEHYQKVPMADIVNALGRSRGSIIARVKKLSRDGFMSYEPAYLKSRYAPQEDKYIIANQELMSLRQVALTLGRSLTSVKARARRLGVSYVKIANTHHNTKYTAEDVELIRQLRDCDLTYADIGRKFGASSSQVRRICNFELRLYQNKHEFISALNRQISAIDFNN